MLFPVSDDLLPARVKDSRRRAGVPGSGVQEHTILVLDFYKAERF